MDKYTLPHYLDEPFKIMLWTLDEFLALGVPLLLCLFVFNSPVVGLITGALGLMGLKQLKGEKGPYFLRHLLYWYLPQLHRLKKTPPSYQRQWLG